MGIIVFAVCLAASVIGGICGIGGGVIIKPVLDAMGVMSVSALQFLSGLTVLGMSAVSVLRRRGEHLLELRTGNALLPARCWADLPEICCSSCSGTPWPTTAPWGRRRRSCWGC